MLFKRTTVSRECKYKITSDEKQKQTKNDGEQNTQNCCHRRAEMTTTTTRGDLNARRDDTAGTMNLNWRLQV